MNITYLLGAGASFNALPIVEQIPKELENFANELDTRFLNSPNSLTFLNEKGTLSQSFLFKVKNDKQSFERNTRLIQKFCEDTLWLLKESKKHNSIDTFAKKLFLQKNNTDLRKLKIVLSCFFLYLQTKKFDKRYESFFASILESLDNLPSKLKILSWNYDLQLEYAYKRFSNQTLKTAKKHLNVMSKESKSSALERNDFSVYKINGTASLNYKVDGREEEYEILQDFDLKKSSLLGEFLELYETTHKSSIPNLSFAWEDFSENSYFNNCLSESVKETEILIVIGYSFPFFNRKVDKFILDSMPNLKNIYVQDPKNSKDIIEKIKGLIPGRKVKHPGFLGPITYEEKKFIDQFFIPIEF